MVAHRVTNEGHYPILVHLAGGVTRQVEPGKWIEGEIRSIWHGDRSAQYSVVPVDELQQAEA